MTKRASTARESPLTHYRNVDLDVYAAVPLDGLVRALGDGASVLYVSGGRRRHEAHLELASSHMDMSADDTILGLIQLLRRLPRIHRQTWNSAKRREFNVGIEAGLEPHGFELRLQHKTVKAIADVGGILAITVYAPDRGGRRSVQPRRERRRLP